MAKIRITTRQVSTGNEWTEDYDKSGIGDNEWMKKGGFSPWGAK